MSVEIVGVRQSMKIVMNTAVVLMALAIPFGFGMALYTDNHDWFLLCAFLLIFLS